MRVFEPDELTFLWREVMTHGDARGVIAKAHLTVWRHVSGDLVMIPDDPADAHIIEGYIAFREGCK